MGILSDIETTIIAGDIHNIKINMFNTMLIDGISTIENSFNSYYSYNVSVYRRNLCLIVRKLLGELKLYDLINYFKLSNNDIKTLFKSGYVEQTNNYIDIFDIIDNIDDYVNNYTDTQLGSCNISDEYKSQFKYAIKKKTLNIPVNLTAEFLTEFEKYIETRIVDKR